MFWNTDSYNPSYIILWLKGCLWIPLGLGSLSFLFSLCYLWVLSSFLMVQLQNCWFWSFFIFLSGLTEKLLRHFVFKKLCPALSNRDSFPSPGCDINRLRVYILVGCAGLLCDDSPVTRTGVSSPLSREEHMGSNLRIISKLYDVQ